MEYDRTSIENGRPIMYAPNQPMHLQPSVLAPTMPHEHYRPTEPRPHKPAKSLPLELLQLGGKL